jgi:hypothetical protein
LLNEHATACRYAYDQPIIEVIATAKRLRRANPRTGERRSFRQIARELQSMGHLNERGYPYNAASIKAMVDRPTPAGVQE